MKTLYLYDDYYLPFIFPGYVVTSSLNEISPMRKVIFRVKGEDYRLPLQNYDSLILQYPYSRLGLDYIILDRKTLVEFLINHCGFVALKKLDKIVEKVGDEEFKRFIVLSIALDKWVSEEDEGEVKVYRLFEALFESKVRFLRLYFEMRRSVSFPELWSAILTFLIKSRRYELQQANLSPFYMRLLKSMNQVGSFKHFVELFQVEKPAEYVVLSALMEVK